jgi:hypothetical protein
LNQGGRARFQDGLSAYQSGQNIIGNPHINMSNELWNRTQLDPNDPNWYDDYEHDYGLPLGSQAERDEAKSNLMQSDIQDEAKLTALWDEFEKLDAERNKAREARFGTNVPGTPIVPMQQAATASTPVAEDKGIASTVFPEGEFQDIRATSKTPTEYNIRATKDLVENLPGGIVRDVVAPAAAGVMSIPYDAMQAMTRTSEADVARAMETAGMSGPKDIAAEAFGTAYARERPLSTAMERMTGAAAPLAERVANLRKRGIDERMARSYKENIQAMADPRMRGAKGGLAKVLGV